MVINPFSTLQIAKKNRILVEKLQNEMDSNFLEHAMYDINDALVSILALCDMEQMKSIPKIKNYIQRVNELLNDVQIYQDEKIFNINHLLRNVIDIIKDNFKDRAKIFTSFSIVKALVKSNQKCLERILLYLLVELTLNPDRPEGGGINVELTQKDTEAQILIIRENFNFSHEQIKEVGLLREDFSGKMEISKKGSGIYIRILLPLSFKSVNSFNLPLTPTSAVRIISSKPVRKSIKSFAKDDV